MSQPSPHLIHYRSHPILESSEQVPWRPGQIRSFDELQTGQELEWVDKTADWMSVFSWKRFRPVTVEALGARMCGGAIVRDHYLSFMHSKELFLAPDEQGIVLRAYENTLPLTIQEQAPYFMNFRLEDCGLVPYTDLEGQVLGWSAAYLRTSQSEQGPFIPH